MVSTDTMEMEWDFGILLRCDILISTAAIRCQWRMATPAIKEYLFPLQVFEFFNPIQQVADSSETSSRDKLIGLKVSVESL